MKSSKLNKIIASFLAPFACFSIGYGGWNIHAEKSYNQIGQKGEDPVAYFEKTENKKIVKHYFTTIEAAGKDTSSNTIYVIPRTDPTISDSCTLYSGDTLRFILDESSRDKDTNDVETNGFADNDLTYRKNQIALKNKLTIQSGATLLISGETGGAGPQGATSGNYCELVIDNGGSIECNGTINCYGFIKDMSETKDNLEAATITVNNGGQIFEPLTIYDWGSGKNALARKDAKIFPFNVFDLPNIRSKMKFSYGGSLHCYIHTYGTNLGHQHAGSAIIVGKAEETAFIQMSSSASLIWNFDSSEISKTGDSPVDHTVYVDIDGDFSLGKLTVFLNEVSVDSSESYLPMPHIYKLTHNNGEANLNYKTKFMPGSSLKIGKNSIVNMNNNVIFYETNQITENQPIYNYYVNTPAVLINDGTININSGFSGFIDTTSETGIINAGGGYYKPADSYEAYDFKDYKVFAEVQKTGPFATGGGMVDYSGNQTGTSITKKGILSVGKYLSKTNFWYPIFNFSLKTDADTTYIGKHDHTFTAYVDFFPYSSDVSLNSAEWQLHNLTSSVSAKNVQKSETSITGGKRYSISYTVSPGTLEIGHRKVNYELYLSLNINGEIVDSNKIIFTTKRLSTD